MRRANFVVLWGTMSLKLCAALITLMLMSGCCEIFGICTSVSVHTSADSANKYAREDSNSNIGYGVNDVSRDVTLLPSSVAADAVSLTPPSDAASCARKPS